MRKCIFYIVFVLSVSHLSAQSWKDDATPLHRAQKTITDIMVHDIFSPPVATRVYAYTSMAAYEVMAKSNKHFHSLYTQVKNFPELPSPTGTIEPSVSAVYAYLMVGKKLLFSEDILQD